jgi:hypothetical protein
MPCKKQYPLRSGQILRMKALTFNEMIKDKNSAKLSA